MWRFVLDHKVVLGAGLAVVLGGSIYTSIALHKDPLSGIATTTAETGNVESIVSVSGITKSRTSANLTFPTSGIVASVPATEGMSAAEGTILATLGSTQQVALLEKATAEVSIAKATLASVRAGTRSEAKDVSTTAVLNAQAEVERITKIQDTLVLNATRALYSNNLIARTENITTEASAPDISGTYHCSNPGTYTVKIYNSGASSGYSANVTGLETGIFTVSDRQASPLGSCGLFLKIAADGNYGNTTWTITVPNQSDTAYIGLKNILELAKETRTQSIESAEAALALAKRKQTLENAAATPEDVAAASARVQAAEATLAEISANLRDRSIVAPFTGVVTAVAINPGESAPQTPVITLLSTSTLEVIARVPEIDITKVTVGNTARMVFDAKRQEPQMGEVAFIATEPTIIDGVSYFEVKINLKSLPTWLRSGLNADVDIVTDIRTNVTKVPSRYLSTADNNTTVRTLTNSTLATTTVTIDFTGNDGYVAVSGLTPGTTIVAP